jgi:hypothetical protein
MESSGWGAAVLTLLGRAVRPAGGSHGDGEAASFFWWIGERPRIVGWAGLDRLRPADIYAEQVCVTSRRTLPDGTMALALSGFSSWLLHSVSFLFCFVFFFQFFSFFFPVSVFFSKQVQI